MAKQNFYALFSLLLFFVLVEKGHGATTADGFTIWNGMQYKYVSASVNWDQAQAACAALNAHLASSLSSQENAFLSSLAGGANALIGLYCQSDRVWRWIGTGQAATYTTWNTGEPNNSGGTENRGVLYTSGKWNDLSPTNTAPGYICKRDSLDNWAPSYDLGAWYKYYSAGATWNQAEATCVSGGAHLTSIMSAAENTYITAFVPAEYSIFIGLARDGSSAFSKWADGQTVGFTKWNSGEPNNAGGGENVGQLLPSSNWNDIAGTNSLGFICKKPLNKTADGWVNYNNNQFKLFTTAQTWDNAEKDCYANKAWLTSVADYDEMYFLYRIGIPQSSVWTGMYMNSDKVYRQIGTGVAVSTNALIYAPGEPSGGSEDKLELYIANSASLSFNDLPATSTRPYICRRDNSANWGWYTWTNGYEYRLVPDLLTFDAAEANCVTMKGHITSVANANEDYFLGQLVPGGYSNVWTFWIGLKRTSGLFTVWTDMTSFSYNAWNSGEPNNSGGNEDCAQKSGGSTLNGLSWNDLSGTKTLASVCKRDLIAPVGTCSNNLNGATLTGLNYLTYTWSAPVFTDNTVVKSTSCDRAIANTTFVYGTTVVSCVGIDQYGNSGFCSFTVIVTDPELPKTANCPSNVQISTKSGFSYAIYNWTVPVFTDNVGLSGGVSCSRATTNTTFALGNTSVVCQATDLSGNVGKCSFSVNVVDTEALLLTCPSNINQNLSAVGATVVPSWTKPVPSDNVGIASFNCSMEPGTSLPTGKQVVSCSATDIAGNNKSCSFTIVVTDPYPPQLNCPSSTVYSTNANVNYLANVTDNKVGATFSCSKASGSTFPVGATTTVNCSAIDTDNNTAFCSFQVTVDQLTPVVYCQKNVTVPSLSGKGYVYYQLEANGTDANLKSFICKSDTGTTIPAGSVQYNVGVTTVTCTALDYAGLSSSCSFSINCVDQENPVITCPSQIISVNTEPGVSYATLNYSLPSASDNDAIASVTCSPSSGSKFSIGSSSVSCTAKDRSGNQISCSFSVKVVDNQAPTISCPSSSMTAKTDLNKAYATVVYPVMGDDNVGMSVFCNPANSSHFNLGTASVVCSAQDASGFSTNCSFSVVVQDQEPPSLSCPTSQTLSTDQGASVYTYALLQPTASDNIKANPVSCDFTSADKFALGSHELHCNVTDTSGNIADCTFTLDIVDNEYPQAHCPTSLSVATQAGKATAAVSWSANATDNIGATLSCSPTSGSTFSVGPTSVECTAIDAAGNDDTCAFSVTVTDTEFPVVTCPEDQTITLTSQLNGTIMLNFTSPTYSDNVGVVNTTLKQGSVYIAPDSTSAAFSKGITIMLFTVRDLAQNTISCSWAVSVFLQGQTDTQAPTIHNCPSPSQSSVTTITKNTASGKNYAAVSWTAITATDNTALASATYTSSPTGYTLGSNFFAGTTVLMTYTAVDTSQNTATCIFFVKVVDNEPPTVTCPSNINKVVDDASSNKASNVQYTLSVKDNVGVASTIPSIAPGSSFPLGDTVVTVTGIDSAGNSASCSFTVHVDPFATTTTSTTISTGTGGSSSSSSSSSSSGSLMYIGVGIGALLLLILILLFVLIMRRKRRLAPQPMLSQVNQVWAGMDNPLYAGGDSSSSSSNIYPTVDASPPFQGNGALVHNPLYSDVEGVPEDADNNAAPGYLDVEAKND